jgi:hypothetical protein
VQKDGAVAVDLPFTFPFLGLERNRIWMSSFGTILFEEPSAVGAPFIGVAGTHSAILAAAGEFDLDRPGASVTTSQPSPTELEVRWLAPLFGSAVLSDVSVVLAANGSVTIEWRQLDLSGGGLKQQVTKQICDKVLTQAETLDAAACKHADAAGHAWAA